MNLSPNQGRDGEDRTIKVIILGDSGVGKTSLIEKFCCDSFESSACTNTIGLDFKRRKVQIQDDEVKFQMWDTAGQERFRNITQMYFRGANGIILCYDTSDQASFDNIEKTW